MRLFIALLFIFFASINRMTAQPNEFVYDYCLSSVSFINYEQNDPKQLLVLDDEGFGQQKAPHYIIKEKSDQTTQVTSKPVAFVSGARIKIRVVVEFRCPQKANCPSPVIVIKGTGVDDALNFDFPAKSITKGNKNLYTYEADCQVDFQLNKVDYFEKFSIEWSIGLGNGTWLEGGTSTNKLYVVYSQPEKDFYKKEPFYLESVFFNSCKPAKGVSLVPDPTNKVNNQAVVSKILAHFSQKNVERPDGKKLQYYGDWSTLTSTSAILVKTLDGQCGAWCMFFIDCLRIQGLKQNENTILSNKQIGVWVKAARTDENKNQTGFYTKNYPYGSGLSAWQFIEPPNGNVYYNVWKGPGYCIGGPFAIDKTTGKWTYFWKEVNEPNLKSPRVLFSCPTSSQSPPIAQSNDCPKSNFGNHQFVIINSLIFDPSYGSLYGTFDTSIPPTQNQINILLHFQDAVVHSYYKTVGDNCDKTHIVWKKNHTELMDMEFFDY